MLYMLTDIYQEKGIKTVQKTDLLAVTINRWIDADEKKPGKTLGNYQLF